MTMDTRRHRLVKEDLVYGPLHSRRLGRSLGVNLLGTGAKRCSFNCQVAPHFLFNTLANVQALVDTGSPQASAVLRSLIAYLRAAVPRLHETSTTLGQE